MPAQHIPTVRYHPTDPPRAVETAEDLASLGEAWRDHPYSAEETAQWQAQQAAAAAETPTAPPRKR